MNDIYELNISYDSGIGTFEETYHFSSEKRCKKYVLFLGQETKEFFYGINKIRVIDQKTVESRISSLQKQKIVYAFVISPSYEVFSNNKVHKIFVNYKETCVDPPLQSLGICITKEEKSQHGQVYYTGYFSADTFDNITDKITKTCQSFFNTDCEVVINWQG